MARPRGLHRTFTARADGSVDEGAGTDDGGFRRGPGTEGVAGASAGVRRDGSRRRGPPGGGGTGRAAGLGAPDRDPAALSAADVGSVPVRAAIAGARHLGRRAPPRWRSPWLRSWW